MTPRRPPRVEVDPALNDISYAIIGAAIEVHSELGAGFDKSVYVNALKIELEQRNVPHITPVPIDLEYRHQAVGQSHVDFLVEDQVAVEILTVPELTPLDRGTLQSRLKALDKQLGLLVNFNVARLKDGIQRVVYAPAVQHAQPPRDPEEQVD